MEHTSKSRLTENQNLYNLSGLKPRTKLIISIVFGLLGLLLSSYGINKIFPQSEIDIPISLIFPILSSMVLGWRYGLISALAGSALCPFFLWPQDGWTNFLTTIIYASFFTLIGTVNGMDVSKSYRLVYYRILMILFIYFGVTTIAYVFLFNPLFELNQYHWNINTIRHLNTNLLFSFAIKDCINVTILTFFSDLIIQIPLIRRMFRLPVTTHMRYNSRIFVVSYIVGLLIWLGFIGLGFVLLNHSGFNDGHYILAFWILFTGGSIGARVIIYYTEKQLINQEIIRASEYSLKVQIEKMPIAYIVWDKDLVCKSWNPAAEKIFGYSADEVIGKSALEAIVPKQVNQDILFIKNELSDRGIETNNINENINKNGDIIICDWTNSLIKDENGEVLEILSMVQDITERKLVEDCLQFLAEKSSYLEGEDFFSSLLNYLGKIINPDYAIIARIVDNGESAQTVALYSNGEIVSNIKYKLNGTPCENVVGKSKCLYSSEIQRLFPLDSLLVDMQADSYIGAPLWNSKGLPVGLIAILGKKPLQNTKLIELIFDLVSTRVGAELERIQIESDLKSSNDQYRLLFDNMTSGFALHEMIYDETGKPIDYRYISANPAFEKLTGIPVSSITGKRVKELLPNLEQYWVDTFGNVALTGKPISYENYQDNIGKYFDTWVFRPNKNQFAVIFHDITERKKSQDAIKESEANLNSLINNRADSIWSIDKHYNFITINNIFHKDYFTAFNIDIRKGMNALEILSPELFAFWKPKYDLALSGQKVVFEFSIPFEDKIQYFETSLNPIITDGEVTGASGFSVNITERKNWEIELLASKERYLKDERIGKIGNWEYNIKTDQVWGSDEAKQIFGFDLNRFEFPLNEVEECIVEKQKVHQALVDLIHNGKEFQLEFEIHSQKTKESRYIWSIAELKFNDQGNSISVSGVMQDITERRKAQEEIKKSLSLLEATLESTADGILVVDLKGIILNYNKKFVDIWQIPNSITSTTDDEKLLQFVLNELKDPDSFIKKVKDLYAHKEETSFDILEFKDGRIIERYSIPQMYNGESVGRVWSFRDITSQKRAEDALRESEYFFKETQRAGFIGSYKTDFVKGFWTSSDVLDQIFGIDENYIRSVQGWLDIVHPTDKDMMNNYLVQEVIGKRQPFNKEYRIKRISDGETRWVLGMGVTEFDDKGNILSLIGTIQDISDRKSTEAELAASQSRLNLAVKSGNIGIWDWDLLNDNLVWDESMYSLYGINKADFGGAFDAWTKLLYPEDKKNAEDEIQAALSGEKEYSPEFRILNPDGTIKHIKADSKTFRDEKGRSIRMIGTNIDITERKRIEAINLSRIHLMQFSSDHSLTELIEETLNETEKHTSSLVSFYHLVDDDQQSLTLQGWSTRTVTEFCKADGINNHYSIDLAGVWADCVRVQRPIIHNDYNFLEERKGMPKGHAKINRELIVPVIRGEKILAILGVGNKQNDYNEIDIETTKIFAELAWDITERKRSEEALRRSERQNRSILKTTLDGFWIVDLNGRFIDVNDAYVQMIGYSREELLEMYIPDIEFLDSEIEVQKRAQRIIKQGNERFESKHRRQDGKIIDVEVSINFLPEEQLFFVFVNDITERKIAENNLRESKANLSSIIENTSDSIWAINTSYEIIYINDIFKQSYLASYGIHLEVGDNILLSAPKSIQSEWKSLYNRAFRNERFVIEDKIDIGFTSLYVEIAINPIIVEGSVVGVSVFSRDISERRKTEEAIRISEERFKAVTDSAEEWIWEVDNAGLYTYSNQVVEKILGYKVEDVVGKLHFYDFFDPDDREALKENAFGVFAQRLNFKDFENINLHRDGSRIILKTTGSPILSHDGELIGYRGADIDITFQKRMELALLESEEKYRLAFVTSPDSVNINKLDGTYVDINDGFTKLTGYKRDEVIGVKSTEIDIWSVPGDRDRLIKGLREKGFVDNLESAFRCKDGSIKTALMSAKIIHINNAPHILSITRDISDRKQMEQALVESENRLRKLFDKSNDAIFLIDKKNGKYLDANDSASKLTGFNQIEIKQKTTSDITPLDSKKRIATISKIKDTVDLGEVEYLRSDGTRRTALLSVIPLSDDKVYGIAHDITERKQYEDTLKILSRAVDQSPASVVITDIRGRIEYVNSKFTAVTGYTTQEAIGKNPSILKSGYTSKDEYKNLWKTILTGREWQGEFCNIKKNGEKYWENALISPITNEKGEIIHFVAVKEDVTEKKEADRRILSSIIDAEERERNRFSRDLHDGLGPLLSTIKLYFQWLSETDDLEKRKIIIEKGDKNLNEAIESIREISNNLSPRTLNSFGVIAAMRNFIDNLNQTKKLSIKFKSNTENRYEKNVEIIVYRIVTELINNTLKYANATKSELKLSFDEKKEVITLTYSDNGKGFDISKVQSSGKGLGLFNITQRVNTLGGIIILSSSEGKGIHVSIELPLNKK